MSQTCVAALSYQITEAQFIAAQRLHVSFKSPAQKLLRLITCALSLFIIASSLYKGPYWFALAGLLGLIYPWITWTLTQLPQDSAFTRLPYVTALGLSGGDLQTGTSEYLDVETAGEYATGRSPRRMEYSISFNADGAGRTALLAADGLFTLHKLVYKNGDATYYAGELHYSDTPSTEKGQEQVTTSTVLLQSAPSFIKKV